MADVITKLTDNEIKIVSTIEKIVNVKALKQRLEKLKADKQAFIDKINIEIDALQVRILEAKNLGVDPSE